MAAIDWTNIQMKYKGLWVALENDNKEVLASGKDAKKVYGEAKKMGEKIPVLFKVPQRVVFHVSW